jgi:hypothetical protein
MLFTEVEIGKFDLAWPTTGFEGMILERCCQCSEYGSEGHGENTW